MLCVWYSAIFAESQIFKFDWRVLLCLNLAYNANPVKECLWRTLICSKNLYKTSDQADLTLNDPLIYWDICTEIQQSDTNLRYITISLGAVCMLIRATGMPPSILMPCIVLKLPVIEMFKHYCFLWYYFLPLKNSHFFPTICYPSLFLDNLIFKVLFCFE